MTEDAERFLNAIHDYLVPVIGPAATGVVGYVLGKRRDNAEAAKIETEADAVALNSITSSFQTLIDGYERRIEDLTHEVSALREEVKDLRRALDLRPNTPPPNCPLPAASSNLED